VFRRPGASGVPQSAADALAWLAAALSSGASPRLPLEDPSAALPDVAPVAAPGGGAVGATVDAVRRLWVVARAALLAPVAAAVSRLAAYVRGSQPRGYTPVPDDGTELAPVAGADGVRSERGGRGSARGSPVRPPMSRPPPPAAPGAAAGDGGSPPSPPSPLPLPRYETVLTVAGVTKRYVAGGLAVEVLSDVGPAELREGTVTCLLGSNGAGKVRACSPFVGPAPVEEILCRIQGPYLLPSQPRHTTHPVSHL